MTDEEKLEHKRKVHAEACKRFKLKHPDRVKAITQKATKKSTEKRKRDKLLKRYGITELEYNELLAKQAGHCALCPATTFLPDDGRSLAVDHDHKTGKVRGLLCQPCNLMLGYARDFPEQLEKGASYLRTHNKGVVP
jgi:hypothetical protein